MQSKRYYCCPKKACPFFYRDRSDHPDHSKELERIPSELTREFSFTKKLDAGANGVVPNIRWRWWSEQGDEAAERGKEWEMKMELKVLIRLHHQCIVRYFKSKMVKKKAYIAMEAWDNCTSNVCWWAASIPNTKHWYFMEEEHDERQLSNWL